MYTNAKSRRNPQPKKSSKQKPKNKVMALTLTPINEGTGQRGFTNRSENDYHTVSTTTPVCFSGSKQDCAKQASKQAKENPMP